MRTLQATHQAGFIWSSTGHYGNGELNELITEARQFLVDASAVLTVIMLLVRRALVLCNLMIVICRRIIWVMDWIGDWGRAWDDAGREIAEEWIRFWFIKSWNYKGII